MEVDEDNDEVEKPVTDPDLQKFYDGFVWDETDLGPAINPDAILDKVGQSCVLALLRMCVHVRKDPDPPLPSEIAPPGSSLTRKEMDKYLTWEEQFIDAPHVEDVLPHLRATYIDYKELQSKVLKEQEKFQVHLSEVAKKRAKAYNAIHVPAADWVKEKLHTSALGVKRYPRYYEIHSTFGVNIVPFTTDTLPAQVENMHQILGQVKNLKPRKFPSHLSPDFMPTGIQKGAKNKTYDKPVISEDKNAEVLAVAWGADLVISMSSLHTLANKDSKFEKGWEMPIVIRTHNLKGDVRKIAFIDKPLPPKVIMQREKNLLYFSKLFKAAMMAEAVSQSAFQLQLRETRKNSDGMSLQWLQNQGGPHSSTKTTKHSSDNLYTPQKKPGKIPPISTKSANELNSKSTNRSSDEFSSMSDGNEKQEEVASTVKQGNKIQTSEKGQSPEELSKPLSDANVDDRARQCPIPETNAEKNNPDEDNIQDAGCKNAKKTRKQAAAIISSASDDEAHLVIDTTDESDVPQVDGASDKKTKTKKKSQTISATKTRKKSTEQSTSKRKKSGDHKVADSKDLSEPDDDAKRTVQSENVTEASNKKNDSSSVEVGGARPVGFLELTESSKKHMIGFNRWKSSFEDLPVNKTLKIDSAGLFGAATPKNFQPYIKDTKRAAEKGTDGEIVVSSPSSKKKSTTNSPFELSFGAAALSLTQDTNKNESGTRARSKKKVAAKIKEPVVTTDKVVAQTVPMRRSRRNRNKKSSEDASSEDNKDDAFITDLPKSASVQEIKIEVPTDSEPPASSRRSRKKGAETTSSLSNQKQKNLSFTGVETSTPKRTTAASALKTISEKQHVNVTPSRESIQWKATNSPLGIFSCTVNVPTKQIRSKNTPVPAPKPACPDSDILGRIMSSTVDLPHSKKTKSAPPPPTKTATRWQDNDVKAATGIPSTRLDTLEEPPGSENVNYALWQFKNMRVLIRYSQHGILPSSDKSDLKLYNVSFQTKLEYQSECVFEQVTLSELCHNWVTTHFKPPGTRIVRGRIDPLKSELIEIEWPSAQELTEKAKLLGFSSLTTSRRLSNIFEKLSDLTPSTYICSYKSGADEVKVHQSVDDPANKIVYDLHEQYKCPGQTCYYTKRVPWVPGDPNKRCKHHTLRNLIPLLFSPRVVEAGKNPRKRSTGKGKKKKKSKKKKANNDDEWSKEDGSVNEEGDSD